MRPAPAEGVARPVAHFATFPLPRSVADFGGGAVTRWGPDDLFATLFEYGPESLGSALFAKAGLPRRMRADDFRPYLLRRGRPGHSGTQWFFTEAERPFTLYVVLGSHARRHALVPRVNALLEASPSSTFPPNRGSRGTDRAPARRLCGAGGGRAGQGPPSRRQRPGPGRSAFAAGGLARAGAAGRRGAGSGARGHVAATLARPLLGAVAVSYVGFAGVAGLRPAAGRPLAACGCLVAPTPRPPCST